MAVQRGEIYLLEIDKERPVLVVQADSLNRRLDTTIVMPLTGAEERAVYDNTNIVPKVESGLDYDSVALCHEVFVINQERVTRKDAAGKLPESRMLEIEDCLQFVLGVLPNRLYKEY